jgi:hypothetical protein
MAEKEKQKEVFKMSLRVTCFLPTPIVEIKDTMSDGWHRTMELAKKHNVRVVCEPFKTRMKVTED